MQIIIKPDLPYATYTRWMIKEFQNYFNIERNEVELRNIGLPFLEEKKFSQINGLSDYHCTVKPLNNGHIGIFLCLEVVRISEGQVVLCTCAIMY